MKKRFLWILLCCALAVGPGAAEEETLFPIQVNGLWGYMNQAGEEVLAPKWAGASLFSGGVARVSAGLYGADGLIDAQGNYVVPPQYSVEEFALSYRVAEVDGPMQSGYYDKASGFYLPPLYEAIHDFGTDRGPVAASRQGLCGYLRRETGETLIPFQYNGEYDNIWFSERYALAADEITLYDETGTAVGWRVEFHLLDTQGRETVFPEGIFPDGPVREGVLRISREMRPEEAAAKGSGWGVAYGLARPDGTILVEPRFDYVSDAADGCVCFWDGGLCGHMDLTGRVIVPAKYKIDLGGPVPEYCFSNGYAVFEDLGENWPETARCVILDREGNEVFSRKSEGGTFELTSAVLDNGWVWYCDRCEDPLSFRNAYGLLKIENGQVNKVTQPIFEDYGGAWIAGANWEVRDLMFSQGMCAVRMGGLWGYINDRGEVAISPAWDAAGPFYRGLAQVMKDGKLGYIDPAGTVVWQEP